MASHTADMKIVKLDEGAVNARLLARESKVDFRRVEAASIKVIARLTSAEGKRLFVRFFSTLQLNAHFISVIARTRLESSDVAKVEEVIKTRIDGVAAQLNQAIDGAEALFKANGIASAATYDTQPLEIEVGIISSSGRRYLELISKLDQLMPLLQTLEIYEVIDTQVLDQQRAMLKRQVRDVANSARSLASGLRRRMNAMAAASGSVVSDSDEADIGLGGEGGLAASDAPTTVEVVVDAAVVGSPTGDEQVSVFPEPGAAAESGVEEAAASVPQGQ